MRTKSAELKKEIYEFVNQYRRERGDTPSLKTIGDYIGVNKSTVYRYLKEMSEDGELRYTGDYIDTKEFNADNARFAKAAIVGSIHCGEAMQEDQYIEEYVNLPENIFGSGEFYILRATGDSMEDADVYEGDLVIILKQPTAEVGDIVVALDDENQNTLKRFAGFDEEGYAVLEYMNEAVYPGKIIKVRNLVVQGVARNVIKTL